jgi:hypothetical protein
LYLRVVVGRVAGLTPRARALAGRYFKDLARHRIQFEAARPKAQCGDGLFAGDEEAIEMAFGKHNAGKRKQWMESWEARRDGAGIDYGVSAMKCVRARALLFTGRTACGERFGRRA